MSFACPTYVILYTSENAANENSLCRYFESSADIPSLWDSDILLLHMKQAQERIQEFDRLRKARRLLDAISLMNDLLADSSEIEILTLAGVIVRRLSKLGVTSVTTEYGMCFTLHYELFSFRSYLFCKVLCLIRSCSSWLQNIVTGMRDS